MSTVLGRGRPGARHLPRSLALVLALVVGGLALVGVLAAYGQANSGVVLPGVRALGLDLGGLSPEEAAAALAAAIPPPAAAIALLDPGDPADPDDDRSWSLTRSELGLAFDAAGAAQAAYEQGRGRFGLIAPLWIRLRGREVQPALWLDSVAGRAALEGLAAEVDVPPVDGDVRLEGGEVVVSQPRVGRQIDVEETLARMQAALADPFLDEVELVTRGTAPRFSDATQVAEGYQMAVSGPVHLTWRQGQRFTADVELVRGWVTVRRAPNAAGDLVPSVVFDEAAIAAWLAGLAAQVDVEVRDARLAYDEIGGGLTVREPSRSGQVLDVAGSVRRFVAAAYTDVRTAELAVETTPPAVGSDVVERLAGRVRVLVSSSTRITGQPPGRALNILLAADRLDGVTLAPGGELSLVRALGPVDEAAGYDMAQVESGGGVLGGGLDQVATSFFRAALWSGLVIVERSHPPTRAAWVEPPIGLDAAVAPPDGDLRFRNDTDGYLIFGCRVDDLRGALVTTVVGPPPARRVSLIGPMVEALEAPAGLPADGGVERADRQQSQWARHGARVSYQRLVRDAETGAEIFRDAIVSSYRPSGDAAVRGSSPGG